jgi:hypothetical protein
MRIVVLPVQLVQPHSMRAARLIALAERSAGEVPVGGIKDIIRPRNTVSLEE